MSGEQTNHGQMGLGKRPEQKPRVTPILWGRLIATTAIFATLVIVLSFVADAEISCIGHGAWGKTPLN
jgi:hypothetical protein